MKYRSIFLLLVVMWIPVLSAGNENAKPLPKFEKLLPSEKFFNKEALPVGHTFGLATNKNLEEIKILLLKALGDGWKLKIAPAEYLESINKNAEMKMEAVGNLAHKDYEKYSIGVTSLPIPENENEEFKDYKRILSIVAVDLEIAAKLNSKPKKPTDQKKEDAGKPSPASKSRADE